MYAGRLVEISTVQEMFTDPSHPYSKALISSLPKLEHKGVFQGIPGLARRCSASPRAAPSTRAARRSLSAATATVPRA